MSDNSFFKPTLLYKEFMILDLIEKDANITQREISKTIGVAVSMTNAYIENFVEKGLIKKKKHSTKTVEYFITNKGMERRKLLNIEYLNASQNIYNSAKENIVLFLNQVYNKGINNILLYGAGEVAELMLDVVGSEKNLLLSIAAVIDDDPRKQGNLLLNKPIISLKEIIHFRHDGILISSYTHHNKITDKLKTINYDDSKIIEFFNN